MPFIATVDSCLGCALAVHYIWFLTFVLQGFVKWLVLADDFIITASRLQWSFAANFAKIQDHVFFHSYSQSGPKISPKHYLPHRNVKGCKMVGKVTISALDFVKSYIFESLRQGRFTQCAGAVTHTRFLQRAISVWQILLMVIYVLEICGSKNVKKKSLDERCDMLIACLLL